jgi:hypothetical protein
MPVIEHYRKQDKVAEVRLKPCPSSHSLKHLVFQINGSPEKDEVHAATVAAVEKVLV